MKKSNGYTVLFGLIVALALAGCGGGDKEVAKTPPATPEVAGSPSGQAASIATDTKKDTIPATTQPPTTPAVAEKKPPVTTPTRWRSGASRSHACAKPSSKSSMMSSAFSRPKDNRMPLGAMRPALCASGGKAECVMMPGASIKVRTFPRETASVMQ